MEVDAQLVQDACDVLTMADGERFGPVVELLHALGGALANPVDPDPLPPPPEPDTPDVQRFECPRCGGPSYAGAFALCTRCQ